MIDRPVELAVVAVCVALGELVVGLREVVRGAAFRDRRRGKQAVSRHQGVDPARDLGGERRGRVLDVAELLDRLARLFEDLLRIPAADVVAIYPGGTIDAL